MRECEPAGFLGLLSRLTASTGTALVLGNCHVQAGESIILTTEGAKVKGCVEKGSDVMTEVHEGPSGSSVWIAGVSYLKYKRREGFRGTIPLL